ncbi:MAG: response regulator [Candidatus Sericytochromatia bacterium]|jgi:two-component system chemotaxis response regulator CheY|nr:response regulator [Candidatus Sericytochromatia bacterium]
MKNILVVDDAAFMRLMLKDILTAHGFNVVAEAKTGVEAVALYQQHQVDLVTMDITMPEMDGLTATRHILNKDPKARIIVCSAMGQQAMVLEAIQSGARDFIVKPFQADRVVDAVKKALR